MSTHQIHVFISHSWSYSKHYDTLADWIFNENWTSGQASLDFRDFSVPKDDPIHDADTDKALREAIYAKIARSHVIVIPTGMYANYSKWIKKEIEGAGGIIILGGDRSPPGESTQDRWSKHSEAYREKLLRNRAEICDLIVEAISLQGWSFEEAEP